MALATVAAKPYGLEYDSRFKHWGKLILSGSDLDLNAKNGYSLTGPFTRWGETVALEPGQFLVVATEAGSRKYASYQYALVGVNDAGEAAAIDEDAITALLTDAHLPDAVRAKIANSALYRYAAYAWTVQQTAPQVAAQPETASLIESLWQQIQSLPESDQVEIRNRLLHAL